MPTIEVELTEVETLALSSDIKDVDFYLTSFIQGRAQQLCDEIVQKEVERALGANETLPASKEEVVRQAFDKGTVKTAQQREQEAMAADALQQPAPNDAASSIAITVQAHALALKISVVNASRSENQQYPITRQSLTEISETYGNIIAAFNTAKNLGQFVAREEEEQAAFILNIYQYHNAVDLAAQAIIEAGDPLDPIASDLRWPAYTI